MITPETSDCEMRSCGMPNIRRNTGSSPNGVFTRTRCLLVTLTTAGSTVVGFDGALRSTADGRTWREGNLDAQPRTLAGSRDGATVLATTPEGLMHSTDGGVSWRWTDQAPLLLMVAFGDGDTVAGLTPDGQVHTSTDAGRTWRATDLLAPDAKALHASGEGEQLEILVANDRTILASNGGQPFQPMR